MKLWPSIPDPRCSHRNNGAGFSLVEVVVAVGIFAVAVISVVGLLVPINNSVADLRDNEDASRLALVVQAQVQQLGFSALARSDATPAGLNYLNTNPAAGIFASRDGSKMGLGNNTSIWGNPVSNKQKFFKVELSRNTTLSPDTSANDSTAGFLALTIKISWPAYNANGDTVDPSAQSVMLVPAAVTR